MRNKPVHVWSDAALSSVAFLSQSQLSTCVWGSFKGWFTKNSFRILDCFLQFFFFRNVVTEVFHLQAHLHPTTECIWLSKASHSNLLYLSVKVDTFSVVWEIRCHSAEVFVSAIWLAAAAAGKSSASLFPQDVVARCDRAAAWWLRHRRRRLRFLPQSLLGQEACQWGWAGKSRSGGAGGKDVRSGVASRSVWENRLDA